MKLTLNDFINEVKEIFDDSPWHFYNNGTSATISIWHPIAEMETTERLRLTSVSAFCIDIDNIVKADHTPDIEHAIDEYLKDSGDDPDEARERIWSAAHEIYGILADLEDEILLAAEKYFD